MVQVLKTFKALSDRNRLLIVAALSTCEQLCACQITELLNVTGATASRHMAALINAGLVSSEKRGRWVHYRLNDRGGCFQPIIDWMKAEFQRDPEFQEELKRLETITACEPQEITRRQREAREV